MATADSISTGLPGAASSPLEKYTGVLVPATARTMLPTKRRGEAHYGGIELGPPGGGAIQQQHYGSSSGNGPGSMLWQSNPALGRHQQLPTTGVNIPTVVVTHTQGVDALSSARAKCTGRKLALAFCAVCSIVLLVLGGVFAGLWFAVPAFKCLVVQQDGCASSGDGRPGTGQMKVVEYETSLPLDYPTFLAHFGLRAFVDDCSSDFACSSFVRGEVALVHAVENSAVTVRRVANGSVVLQYEIARTDGRGSAGTTTAAERIAWEKTSIMRLKNARQKTGTISTVVSKIRVVANPTAPSSRPAATPTATTTAGGNSGEDENDFSDKDSTELAALLASTASGLDLPMSESPEVLSRPRPFTLASLNDLREDAIEFLAEDVLEGQQDKLEAALKNVADKAGINKTIVDSLPSMSDFATEFLDSFRDSMSVENSPIAKSLATVIEVVKERDILGQLEGEIFDDTNCSAAAGGSGDRRRRRRRRISENPQAVNETQILGIAVESLLKPLWKLSSVWGCGAGVCSNDPNKTRFGLNPVLGVTVGAAAAVSAPKYAATSVGGTVSWRRAWQGKETDDVIMTGVVAPSITLAVPSPDKLSRSKTTRMDRVCRTVYNHRPLLARDVEVHAARLNRYDFVIAYKRISGAVDKDRTYICCTEPGSTAVTRNSTPSSTDPSTIHKGLPADCHDECQAGKEQVIGDRLGFCSRIMLGRDPAKSVGSSKTSSQAESYGSYSIAGFQSSDSRTNVLAALQDQERKRGCARASGDEKKCCEMNEVGKPPKCGFAKATKSCLNLANLGGTAKVTSGGFTSGCFGLPASLPDQASRRSKPSVFKRILKRTAVSANVVLEFGSQFNQVWTEGFTVSFEFASARSAAFATIFRGIEFYFDSKMDPDVIREGKGWKFSGVPCPQGFGLVLAAHTFYDGSRGGSQSFRKVLEQARQAGKDFRTFEQRWPQLFRLTAPPQQWPPPPAASKPKSWKDDIANMLPVIRPQSVSFSWANEWVLTAFNNGCKRDGVGKFLAGDRNCPGNRDQCTGKRFGDNDSQRRRQRRRQLVEVTSSSQNEKAIDALDAAVQPVLGYMQSGALTTEFCLGSEDLSQCVDPARKIFGKLTITPPAGCAPKDRSEAKLAVRVERLTLGALSYLISEKLGDAVAPVGELGIQNATAEIVATEALVRITASGSPDLLAGDDIFRRTIRNMAADLTLRLSSEFRFDGLSLNSEASVGFKGSGSGVGVDAELFVRGSMGRYFPPSGDVGIRGRFSYDTMALEGEIYLSLLAGIAVANGDVSQIGTWWNAVGKEWLHVSDARVGLGFNVNGGFWPIVPVRLEMGGNICIGTKQSCEGGGKVGPSIRALAFVEIDVTNPANNFVFVALTAVTLSHLTTTLSDAKVIDASLANLLDNIPKPLRTGTGIMPFELSSKCPQQQPAATANASEVPPTPLTASSSTTFSLDCYAYFSVSPAQSRSLALASGTIEIPRGLQLGFSVSLLEQVIQVKAQVSSSVFFVNASMDELNIRNVLQLGATLDSNNRAVGRPRFVMDYRLLPTISAFTHIEGAFSIPPLKSYGSALVTLNDEGFAFVAELSLFDGVLTANTRVAWDWSFDSFIMLISATTPFDLGFTISGATNRSSPAIAQWNKTSGSIRVDAAVHVLAWNAAVTFEVVGDGEGPKSWLGMSVGPGGWYGNIESTTLFGLATGSVAVAFDPQSRFGISYPRFAVGIAGRVDFSSFLTSIAGGFEEVKKAVENKADSRAKSAGAESPWVRKVNDFLLDAENKVDSLCSEMFGSDTSFCSGLAGWVGDIAGKLQSLLGKVMSFSFSNLVSSVRTAMEDATAAVTGYVADALKTVAGGIDISAGADLSLVRGKQARLCTREHCFGPMIGPGGKPMEQTPRQKACWARKAACKIPRDYWLITYKFDANVLGFSKTISGIFEPFPERGALDGCNANNPNLSKCLWNHITQSNFQFDDIVGSFVDGASGLLGKIEKAWGDAKEKVERFFEKLVAQTADGAKEWFENAMSSLTDYAKEFGEKATTAAKDAFVAAENAFKAAGAALDNAVGGLAKMLKFRKGICDKAATVKAAKMTAYNNAKRVYLDFLKWMSDQKAAHPDQVVPEAVERARWNNASYLGRAKDASYEEYQAAVNDEISCRKRQVCLVSACVRARAMSSLFSPELGGILLVCCVLLVV